MSIKYQIIITFVFLIAIIQSFRHFPQLSRLLLSKRHMVVVEIIFPNNKKVKVASGSTFKDAAKTAGFSPDYGCEEGNN